MVKTCRVDNTNALKSVTRTDVLMKARIVSNLAQSAEEIVLILAIRLVILDRNAKKAYVKVR